MAFVPSPEVAAILNALLDIYERRELMRRDDTVRRQAIRVNVGAGLAENYFSQTDPMPRQIANDQLTQLARAGLLKLDWVRGEQGHLLAAISLDVARAEAAYEVVGRASLASKRHKVLGVLLAERSRWVHFSNGGARSDASPDAPQHGAASGDAALLSNRKMHPSRWSEVLNTDVEDAHAQRYVWQIRALSFVIQRLREGLSAAPFRLNDPALNDDLLTVLDALPDCKEETPQRVFSVRVFNDSKRFEQLAPKIVTLAKRGHPAWRSFKHEEVLRELNVVANPNHLFLFGDWELIDSDGQVLNLGAFEPSVGLPAAQAARLQRARVAAPRIICVENLTSFYELVRARTMHPPFAALCLAGNPSPACRHLLRCLPRETPLHVWADMDYGGFNILAQIRAQVNSAAQPVWMDAATFEPCAQFARPLQPNDVKRLSRLLQHALLADAQPAIVHLLARGLKLEQEAIRIESVSLGAL